MNFRDFWYIAADSRKLRAGQVISSKILGEWLAVFRDETGKAVALQDKCLHRCSQLSTGRVEGGKLQCAYHGWTYDGGGNVVAIPSEGPGKPKQLRRAVPYLTMELDDYIYVRLAHEPSDDVQPFRVPCYKQDGWKAIRLVNRFRNNVTNCAENFIDIPHTVFVHPRIFRDEKRERFTASVRRKDGSVSVEYHNERANLGIFSWFLNPKGREIGHTDNFHMPNVTSVDYVFSPRRRFIITSQSVPLSDEETIVYTDLTYNYGIWNALAAPIVRKQAQTIIDQDVDILGEQMRNIKRYGDKFCHTEADVIHLMVESIRDELAKGSDPRLLPEKSHEIEFWV